MILEIMPIQTNSVISDREKINICIIGAIIFLTKLIYFNNNFTRLIKKMSVIYSYGERDKQGVNNLNGLPDDTK